jgi:hypothetical protein
LAEARERYLNTDDPSPVREARRPPLQGSSVEGRPRVDAAGTDILTTMRTLRDEQVALGVEFRNGLDRAVASIERAITALNATNDEEVLLAQQLINELNAVRDAQAELPVALGERVDRLTARIVEQQAALGDKLEQALGELAGAGVADANRVETALRAMGAQQVALAGSVEAAVADIADARVRQDASTEAQTRRLLTAFQESRAEQAALAESIDRKVDQAVATVAGAEYRLRADAAADRQQWRDDLAEVVDTFAAALQAMSGDHERFLQEAVQRIRADVAEALQKPTSLL